MSPERTQLLALLRRHGWNATSFQGLELGFRYWFEGDAACVPYVDTGSAWVAAGAPICAAERIGELARRFTGAARAAGRRAAFFAAEQRLVGAAGLAATPIGEQPSWDPRRWGECLSLSRSLREQLRRARNKGLRVRRLDPIEIAPGAAMRGQVERLIERWLRDHAMAPMGFLVDVQPFSFPHERRYFVAERDDEVRGFLSAVPIYARSGWLLEDLLRDPAAPNGTVELLVDAAMSALAHEGSAYVTLGLAPLYGSVSGTLRAVRELSAPLFDFDGLGAFKSKLRPHAWTPIYLAYPPDASSHRALVDALRAFARGSLLRFGARTLARSPARVLRALAS